MPVITKRWEVASAPPPEAIQELSGYPPILQQILYNRGYHTHEQARIYLEAQTPPGCEPVNLLNLPKAVDRISHAIKKHEKIVVYGDYDADGVTATALLGTALKSLGAEVREYIPNRFDEGYGLNLEALHLLTEEGTNLIISVDCGIRSWEEADYVNNVGIDLIITDHHTPLDTLPNAFAVINPKQSGDLYPEKNLAGVGLAYKLVEALALSGQYPNLVSHDYLDLVALGTVADMVPLTGENRSLVRSGLEYIRQPIRQGMMALIGVSGLNPSRINSTDIGFTLAPRINASGRLESALASLSLLTSLDPMMAGQLAQWLEIQNRERQRITREILAKAEKQIIIDDQVPLLLFAADPEYNSGVVGLAASRLTEQYYRPSIIASIGEVYTRASCRSIPEFHITYALDQCKDLLEHHGGHAAAAGFTVRNDLLPTLIERLRDIANKQLKDLDLRQKIFAEMDVPLSELKPDLLKYLNWLQPTGMGNPAPIFMSSGLRVTRQKAIGADSSHLKLAVTDGKITYDAIAFRQGHWIAQLPPRIDLMFTFELNEFNGQVNLQLNVKDIRESTH
ncbi:MAG: single-stranded-DNA-specific exonuclease RecJ [Chloroflexi bacterium RBG_13_48_10]|nr:MAG: single-stranded-DNA-specific exonuclease RecJ [Chloroflexi bacterium RBG_13_48_10]